MIPLKNKKVAVLGVLDAGIAAIRFAHQQGAKVKAFGFATKKETQRIQQILNNVPFQLATQEIPVNDLLDFDVIITTPGTRRYLSHIESAREKGIPVMTDLELACEFYRAPMIAVTGTNGKSTVVDMIRRMLEAAGKKVLIAGGDYTDFADSVLKPTPCDYEVLELSSTRLERVARFHPHIAVFLNLYPGHAERYSSLAKYAEVKARIFAEQTEDDFLIHQNWDYLSQLIQKKGCKAKTYPFSYTQPLPRGATYHPKEKQIIFTSETGEKDSFSTEGLALKGPHNIENILATVCVGKICGIPHEAIQEMMRTVQPLPNRMEFVQKASGVGFINDAKASNVAATVSGLQGFEENSVILIAGGEYRTGQVYSDLCPLLKRYVRCLIIFGESRRDLYKEWGGATETYVVPHLKEAIELASRKAEKGNVVLFSPACRPDPLTRMTVKKMGEEFKEAVKKIALAQKGRQSAVQRI